MDGTAIVFCDKGFQLSDGKTAHGLVRHTDRYQVMGVIDSDLEGHDAGQVLDGRANGIPIFASLSHALKQCSKPPQYFVIGLAPDGGGLPQAYRQVVVQAIESGLNIDSGLHDFLSEDEEFSRLADEHGVAIRDVRKPPHRNDLHFFTNRIDRIKALKIAVLGTDSAVGKRTVSVELNKTLNASSIKSKLIGTGQTSWFQGVENGFILDSTVNDFVAGEIEHAMLSAWNKNKPQVIILEGQGSLLHPAYPGGFELLAAGRPQVVVLQHPPMRTEYDGVPGYPLDPLDKHLQVVELLTGCKPAALTINHENMTLEQVDKTVAEYEDRYGLPVCDVLFHGTSKLVTVVKTLLKGMDR